MVQWSCCRKNKFSSSEILEYFKIENATYGYWVYMLQEMRVVLEVQVVLEDLDAHHNQCLVSLVGPEVQEGLLQHLPSDPNMKERNLN